MIKTYRPLCHLQQYHTAQTPNYAKRLTNKYTSLHYTTISSNSHKENPWWFTIRCDTIQLLEQEAHSSTPLLPASHHRHEDSRTTPQWAYRHTAIFLQICRNPINISLDTYETKHEPYGSLTHPSTIQAEISPNLWSFKTFYLYLV